jgi:hypothetical protein
VGIVCQLRGTSGRQFQPGKDERLKFRVLQILRPFPDFAGKGRFAFGEQLTLRPLLSRVT